MLSQLVLSDILGREGGRYGGRERGWVGGCMVWPIVPSCWGRV